MLWLGAGEISRISTSCAMEIGGFGCAMLVLMMVVSVVFKIGQLLV